MAHFLDQYIHMIEKDDDYDALANSVDYCIRNNIIGHVLPDIKKAIDRLNIDTPFYKFLKTLVGGVSLTQHAESILDVLRQFSNKVALQYDDISFDLEPYTLAAVFVCTDHKDFIKKLPPEKRVQLAWEICSWNLYIQPSDKNKDLPPLHPDRNVVNQEFLEKYFDLSMLKILDGATLQDLDAAYGELYASKDWQEQHPDHEHLVNEVLRPFQAIFINLVQNMDQQEYIMTINQNEWEDSIRAAVAEKAQQMIDGNVVHLTDTTDTAAKILEWRIHDFILDFKYFDTKVIQSGAKEIECAAVGWFLMLLLRAINELYETFPTRNEVAMLLRAAFSIFKQFYAVNQFTSVALNNIINDYHTSPNNEDIFLQDPSYKKALKLHLDTDPVFNEYKQSMNWTKTWDVAYRTYVNQFRDPLVRTADSLILRNGEDPYKLETDYEPKPRVEAAAEAFLDGIRDLVRDTFPEDDGAMEAAGYSSERKYPVFILLTLGHTVLSKIITGVTGDEFSHASISFDITLDPLYSFGTKKLYRINRELGFITTNTSSNLWRGKPCKYELYVTYVDKQSYDKMKSRLEYFYENRDTLKYDFKGLVKNYFGLKSTTEKKYFCSRFVSEILSCGRPIEKDPSLYRPAQLSGIDNLEMIDSGPAIQKYNYLVAEKELARMKRLPDHFRDLQVATEAKSSKWDPNEEPEEDEEEEPPEDEYEDPDSEIEARQSTKGYKKGSKVQADAERKIYGAYKKYKNNEEKVDSQLSKMLSSAKRAFSQDKTEEIIEGKKFTPIGLLKKVLTTAAIFNFSKVAGFAYLLTSHTTSKKRTAAQKKEILLQIDTELKMLDEKIEDARGDGNRKAKYALMRTKAELERARDKIKYNLSATKEDMQTAKKYINNESRDNL